MSKTVKLSQKKKDLIRRYLVWCYKTTKEAIDRTDRYFTQLEVDHFVLKELTSSQNYASAKADPPYKICVDDFRAYMDKKQAQALKQKFTDAAPACRPPAGRAGTGRHVVLNVDYRYLQNRFAAVEKAVSYFLGAKELDRIRALYETEMTRRILEAREHQ